MSEEIEVDVPKTMKALARLATKLKKHHDRFTKTLAEDSPATTDFHTMEEALKDVTALQKDYLRKAATMEGEEENPDLVEQDDQLSDEFTETLRATKFTLKLLLSKRAVHRAMVALNIELEGTNQAFMEEPNGDYSAALESLLIKRDKLSSELEETDISLDAPLMIQSAASLKNTCRLQAKLSKKPPAEAKLDLTRGKPSGPKMAAIAPPTFSGKRRDWQSFWTAFKDIHESPKFTDSAKLGYLREAQKDVSLYNQICQNIENGDPYEDVLSSLKDQFDKPRDMHRIYVNNVLKMGPVKPTKSSLMACATTVKSSLDGLTRLKQLDAHSIFTTIIEPLLPEKVKDRREELTVDKRTIPPVEELIAFLKQRAAMPQYEDKITPTPSEKNKGKASHQKHRGSTHVATAPTVPSTPSSKPPTKGTSSTQPSTQPTRAAPFQKRYVCPLCFDHHYPYQCSTFDQYSVAQRKEHVRVHNLCSNCLKPGHTPSICRSTFKCRTCQGDHNSLLHDDRSPAAPPAHAATNSASAPPQSQAKDQPMMTSQVIITGPTGTSLVARALLDSGFNLSILSTTAKKTLSLRDLESRVYIEGVGSSSSSTTPCPMVRVSLSSSYKKE